MRESHYLYCKKLLLVSLLEQLEHLLVVLQIWHSLGCRPIQPCRLPNGVTTRMLFMRFTVLSPMKVFALWKGAGPTVVRAMSLNMGMLASYDQSVELFRDKFGAGELSTMLGKIDITFVLGFHVIFCILIRESKCQDSPFSIACMCRWGAKVRARELKNLAISTCYFTFIVNRSINCALWSQYFFCLWEVAV